MPQLNKKYIRAKRTLDLTFASIGLIVLSPLMALVALSVLVKLGLPVFFRQQRPGLLGRPFWLFKFRTMKEMRDENGNLLPDTVRLKPFGRFLRSLSLDEIPQLINVLRGEMSLVGPRPLLMQYLDRYSWEEARRHEVLPGITGWAQVNGRNALTWEQRFALDTWYVDHANLGLDLKILGLTVWKILTREGISHPGHATMEEFNPSRNTSTGLNTESGSSQRGTSGFDHQLPDPQNLSEAGVLRSRP